MTAVIFEGGNPQSEMEKAILPIRKASCLDTIENIMGLPELYDQVILATNYHDLAEAAQNLGASVFCTRIEGFHFGEIIRELVVSNHLKTVLYMSGAGNPLLDKEGLTDIAIHLLSRPSVIYTNNVWASDIVGWSPGGAINQSQVPQLDNALAWSLHTGASLPYFHMPFKKEYQMDIDAPADVLLLKSISLKTSRLAKSILDFPWSNLKYNLLIESLRTHGLKLWISGRISGDTISYLNTYLNARLRVVSEERGMKSQNQANYVQSFLGAFINNIGLAKFIHYLENCADIAVIDARPIFAHFKLHPSQEDLFHSNLGEWRAVKDPFIREFTRATEEAKIPIITGGHSLVKGGILALVDAAKDK